MSGAARSSEEHTRVTTNRKELSIAESINQKHRGLKEAQKVQDLEARSSKQRLAIEFNGISSINSYLAYLFR